MCTVTIVPLENGFRLSCNRDERRDRATAAPPAIHIVGQRQAIFPVDPTSQGTWVGVNDAGVAVALLNRTPHSIDACEPDAPMSRGCIIPPLLACDSSAEVLERCMALDPRAFGRFRLLIVQSATLAIVTSDTRALCHEVVRFSRPVMHTSSSLGDTLVEGPRGRLFQHLFNGSPDTWVSAQRHFQNHRWPSRPDISVLMERGDARTVSQTEIEVRSRVVAMAYRAIGSAQPPAAPLHLDCGASRA